MSHSITRRSIVAAPMAIGASILLAPGRALAFGNPVDWDAPTTNVGRLGRQIHLNNASPALGLNPYSITKALPHFRHGAQHDHRGNQWALTPGGALVTIPKVLRIPYVVSMAEENAATRDFALDHILVGFEQTALPATENTNPWNPMAAPVSNNTERLGKLLVQVLRPEGLVSLKSSTDADATGFDFNAASSNNPQHTWTFRGNRISLERTRKIPFVIKKANNDLVRAWFWVGFEGGAGY